MAEPVLSTDDVMREIRAGLRDETAVPAVERQLVAEDLHAAAREVRSGGQLMRHLAEEESYWRLDDPAPMESHRAGVGPVIVLFKKRLLLPLSRWLYTYTRQRLWRQEQCNETLVACLEVLAVENAGLRRELDRLRASIEELRRGGPPSATP